MIVPRKRKFSLFGSNDNNTETVASLVPGIKAFDVVKKKDPTQPLKNPLLTMIGCPVA